MLVSMFSFRADWRQCECFGYLYFSDLHGTEGTVGPYAGLAIAKIYRLIDLLMVDENMQACRISCRTAAFQALAGQFHDLEHSAATIMLPLSRNGISLLKRSRRLEPDQLGIKGCSSFRSPQSTSISAGVTKPHIPLISTLPVKPKSATSFELFQPENEASSTSPRFPPPRSSQSPRST